MGVVFSVFATVAFTWTIIHGVFCFVRWLREPTFEVLNASFTTKQRKQDLWVVEGGLITIVAFGGARTRKIVNWKFILFRRTEDGRGAGGGINTIVEPILETIPAHESTKFTLRVQSGMAFEEIPERLTGDLSLRLDKYWTRVEFPLRRVSTGDFHYDTPISEIAPWMSAPWWKRALSRLKRLV